MQTGEMKGRYARNDGAKSKKKRGARRDGEGVRVSWRRHPANLNRRERYEAGRAENFPQKIVEGRQGLQSKYATVDSPAVTPLKDESTALNDLTLQVVTDFRNRTNVTTGA